MKPRKETAPLAKEREIRALLARKAREKLSYTQLSRLTGIPKGTLAFWGTN
jgi:predicted AAA+ superfamily ATPase